MLQTLKASFPTTDAAVGDWVFLLISGYLVIDLLVAAAFRMFYGVAKYSIVNSASNGILFATSVVLLLGAINRPTLAALGALTTYLLFSGFIGAGFAIGEIFKKRR